MSGITAQVIGVDAIVEKLAALDISVQVRAKQAVSASTLDAVTMAKQLSPVATGFLRSRWQFNPIGSSPLLVLYELSNDAKYAIYVIYGHHTHSGSFVPPQDCLTPAVAYGQSRLMLRLAAIAGAP